MIIRKLPLFHLLPAEQFERMKNAGRTWDYAMRHYRQPDWCSYPGALDGMMGCWSLVGRHVTGEAYCAKGCECYKPVQVPVQKPDSLKKKLHGKICQCQMDRRGSS